MVVLSIQIDRRQRVREGLLAQLEDITYTALRRCYANVLDKVSPALELEADVSGNVNVVSASSLTALSEKHSIA